MKAKISTFIETDENKMWKELQKVSSLMHVASPILKFKPKNGQVLPEKWTKGEELRLKLLLFGFIPLGDHVIKLVEINKNENLIISNERGRLTEVWNHTIKFESINNHKIKYTDEIEIEAGILTWAIWLFAQVFYRHRQNKWKELMGS